MATRRAGRIKTSPPAQPAGPGPTIPDAAFFQAWVEASQDAIFVINRSLRLEYLNPFAARLRGGSLATIKGKHLRELSTPEDYQTQRRYLKEVFASESPRYHENEFYYGGRKIWLGTRLVPLWNPEGDLYAVLGVSRDITAQMDLEEALRGKEKSFQESERKYQSLVERLPGVVYLASVKKPTELLYVSPRIKDLVGFSSEEWLAEGKIWLERLYPEDRDRLYNAAVLAVETVTPFIQEYRLRNRKGETLWVYDQAHPVTDDKGNPLFFQGVVIDISRRKKAEEDLIRAEERYRLVVDNTDEGVLVLQDEGVKFCNPKTVEISGYSVEEQLSRPFLEFIHPDDRERVLKNHRRRLKKQSAPSRYEIRFLKKNGEIRFLRLNTKLISWDNRPASLVFATDITEKKLIREALQESEGRYRTLFEATEDGVVITTEEGRILALNQACRRLFAIPQRASLKKLSVPDFYVNPQDRQTYIRTMKRKGFVSNYEIPYRKADGRLFTGTITATLQKDADGRPIFMGIIRDVTQRKQNELELEKSRKALQDLSVHLHTLLEEERRQISRRIHDDLGQQLTALKMDLFWLGRHYPGQPPHLNEKIGSMSQILDDTIHTVQNICEELRPALLDNLGLIDALEWQINNFRQRTGLDLELIISPHKLLLPQEDATLIFRLFQEALNNIFLHARASRVIITLRKKANLVELTIRDNGLGITEAQINSPRSFGLLGMRERVDARGGKINIRGLAGKGTEVAIKIPLSKKEQRHD